MKYIILVFIFVFNMVFCAFGQSSYLINQGKRFELTVNNSKKYTTFNNINSVDLSGINQTSNPLAVVELSKSLNSNDTAKEVYKHKFWTISENFEISKTDEMFLEYQSPTYFYEEEEVIIFHTFFVKLKNSSDIKMLDEMAETFNVQVLGNDQYMPLWYELSVNKFSKGTTLEIVNKLYETNLFAYVEPNIQYKFEVGSISDPLFNEQWYLKNTGQNGGVVGMDIDISKAWEITKGCNDVIVAVIDQGLEFNHPDFGSFSSSSFDATSGTSPSQMKGHHGVFVAGIIAAQHNSIGIGGVAPNVTLMSISDPVDDSQTATQRLASGINFAWNNGADIINNSWGLNSFLYPQLLVDAIEIAASQGRGGLGTIIIHSTGNEDSNIIRFPSNLADVIAVGAINRNGTRASFSNYGTGLDLVAGGQDIRSTDRVGVVGYNTQTSPNGDYHITSGTSHAAPQVAGVAALILSIKPNLTAIQVRNIMEKTADKVPGYTYNFGAGENPSLSWHNHVGYGKLNAYKALLETIKDIVQGPSLLCSTNSFTVQNLPGGSSVSSWSVTPSRLFSGSTSGTSSSATLTPNATSSGQATITFVVNTSCGVLNIPKTFWVGKPATPGAITGNTNPGPGSITPYYINNLPSGATSMTWSLPYCVGCSQPWSFYSGQNSIMMTANVGDSDGYVQAMGVNSCGTGGVSLLYVTSSGSCDPCPRMYPNPVSDEMTLEWMDTEGFVITEDIESYRISLYNAVGGIILTEIANKPSITIDLSQLKNGFYYLHIESKGELIRKQIRVER